MENNRRRIGLIGMPNAKNYGDPILFKSAEYLIKKVDPDLSITELDLNGYDPSVIKKIVSKSLTLISIIVSKIGFSNSELVYQLQHNATKVRHNSYYKSIMSKIDTAIFAGGGVIKYKYENIDQKISAIVSIAEKMGIDVKFHSVGVEGYSESNLKCQKLKKSLNSDSVSSISTRDDFEILEKNYIDNPKITVSSVADSAFWVNCVYSDVISPKGDDFIVGLGVGRGNIFVDNGVNFDENDQIEFWLSFVKLLDDMKIKWEFYTNGALADIEFLNKLLLNKYFQNSENKILTNNPIDDVHLINIINKFSTVFSIRMHSSIVAYSLEIPSFGLVWNDKVRILSQIIGHENRYYTPEQINIDQIVKSMIDSKFTDLDINTRNTERQKTLDYLVEQLSQ